MKKITIYATITNIVFILPPAIILAAMAESRWGMVGWLVLGGVCAGLRQWGLVGLYKEKRR